MANNNNASNNNTNSNTRSSPSQLLTVPTFSSSSSSSGGKYTLKWNEHKVNITKSITKWRQTGKFFDATLVTEDGSCFDVHKIVLCVSSGFLEGIIKDNPCDHPMIILKDIYNDQLKSILNFIYTGEIQLEERKLEEFLNVAQSLKIKGLTESAKATKVECQQGEARGREVECSSSPAETATDEEPLPLKVEPAAVKQQHQQAISASLKQQHFPAAISASLKQQEQAISPIVPNVGSILIQALEHGKRGFDMSNNPLDLAEGHHSPNEMSSDEDGSNEYRFEDDDEEMDGGGNIGQSLAGLLSSGIGATGNSNSSQDSHYTSSGNNAVSCGRNNTETNRLAELRVRATDPRPCPKCGKIYRSAHTLRTHLEDKHTLCPGYRCVLCGTVAKSRNSLHSHMSRQHRGISTKDLPVLPMPSPFDPGLAARLINKGNNGAGGAVAAAAGLSAGGGIGKFGGGGGAGGGIGKFGGGGGGISASALQGIEQFFGHNDKSMDPHHHQPSSSAIITKHQQPNSHSHAHNNKRDTSSTTGSAILDTYLHFIAENSMAALASSLGLTNALQNNTNQSNNQLTGNNINNSDGGDDNEENEEEY